MKRTVAAVIMLLFFLLSCCAYAEIKPAYPILFTYYRQIGWGDRVEVGYIDSQGELWGLSGYDSQLHWPYSTDAQFMFLQENQFKNLGKLGHDDLFDLKSLINAVEVFDGKTSHTANDAGIERTYAIRYSTEGEPEFILLGMSGDNMFENPDPNAQGLYLAVHRMFPNVTHYAGLMGPSGFIPVSLTSFCHLGDLNGATVKAFYMDCEGGPAERELSVDEQAKILYTVMNSMVTGKVSAADTTGGYTDYGFYKGEEYLGHISIYNGYCYHSDGMYSIEIRK